MNQSEQLSSAGSPEHSPGVADEPRNPDEPLRSPAELLERLRAQPGGAELLELAPPGAYLVGGAVRDLLCERTPRELDVVLVDEDAPFGCAVAELAERLAARFGVPAGSSEHGRFGTAVVEWGAGRIDVAAARRERYSAPGALPEVEAAPLAEDLRRRDFTVNALALALDDARPRDLPAAESGRAGGADEVFAGELLAVEGALEDLRAGRLRVQHERSFLDDPTRLLRLARYRARLGFAVEEHTAELARAAVAGGALGTISGARVGAELRLALAEADPVAAFEELARLGVLGALHPRLRFEPALVRRALALLGAEADDGMDERRMDGAGRPRSEADRPDLLVLAATVLPLVLRADGNPRGEIVALLDRLEFSAGDRDRVDAAAAAVPSLVDDLPRAASRSELRAVALPVPPEGVALAGAVSGPAAAAARRWLEDVRRVRLAIGGRDLLAAGVPEGPEIGRRLEAALELRIDGELPDEREAQLRAALERR
jgi:tRNA nucleotidyltransferase (CCA-adding enzyme)